MCTIVHTVQVQHLHLAQFGQAGPTLALKVQGACHTLSATSLSEVALRRTCTESIRKKSTLKTALTKKKTKFALSTLGVIYFLIYLPNYRKIAPSPLCGARASQPCSPPYAQHGTLQPATGHTVRHSLPPYATLAAILRLFSSWVVAGWYFAALAQHRHHALLSNINSEAGAHFLPLCVRE